MNSKTEIAEYCIVTSIAGIFFITIFIQLLLLFNFISVTNTNTAAIERASPTLKCFETTTYYQSPETPLPYGRPVTLTITDATYAYMSQINGAKEVPCDPAMVNAVI